MTAPGSFDHLKGTYFEECAELLDAAYGHFAALESGSGDADTIHAIFRAIHSMKGGGGAFGFQRMVAFAHQLETVLDLLRDNRLALTADTTKLLVRATDMLSDLIGSVRDETPLDDGVEDDILRMLRELATGGAPSAATPATHAAPAPATRPPGGIARYRIRFAPRASLFQSANEPLLIVRELMRLGTLDVEPDISRLPDLSVFDPQEAYLAWTMRLETTHPLAAIQDAFDFVIDDCDLRIEAEAAGDAPARPAAQAPAMRAPIPAKSQPTPQGATPPPPQREGHASIRVDVEKVDRLVNLVGELVINQSMLVELSGRLPPDLCAGVLGGLATMSQHLRELQEGVMGIRAQPVRSVFSRMTRLLRELSSQLGKDVRLVVTGEATEIDKTVIEQLADPLTHLLRNALDHGIEPPDEREAGGKPRQGVVRLSAAHRGGRIVIELADDGRGIRPDKVLAKARQRGLVAEDATPSDEEIHQLIFLPGFSTADVVSDISGRGVGMDVVKRNIQALSGRITVESRVGFGSRFVLSVPLTLAILDGMAVAVGGETYIVPITHVIESLRPKPESIHPVMGCGDVVTIRGEYVPLVYLHQSFMVPGAVTDPCQGIVVIVESDGARRIGIVVDELIGQQQVVVKSLEANYGAVNGVGGATILGDGRVALILDINRLQDTSAAMPIGRAPVGPHVAIAAPVPASVH